MMRPRDVLWLVVVFGDDVSLDDYEGLMDLLFDGFGVLSVLGEVYYHYLLFNHLSLMGQYNSWLARVEADKNVSSRN